MKKLLLILVFIFSFNFSIFSENLDFTVHLGGAVQTNYNYWNHINFWGDCDITLDKLLGWNLEVIPNCFVKPYIGFYFFPLSVSLPKGKYTNFDFNYNKYRGFFHPYFGLNFELDVANIINTVDFKSFDTLKICVGFEFPCVGFEFPINLKFNIKQKMLGFEQNYGISSSDYSYGLSLFGKAGLALKIL